MSLSVSKRVQRVKPSPTMAVTALAAELRAAGKDIIGLGAGEPDFDTPQHIKAAAIEAINKGDTKYTNVDGTPALKQAIINKFKTDNELSYEPNQILVSSGGKQTCFNVCLAVLDEGLLDRRTDRRRGRADHPTGGEDRDPSYHRTLDVDHRHRPGRPQEPRLRPRRGWADD